MVLAYVAHRQQQGIVNKEGERIGDVSNAQINRELEILKRCFSLALQHGRIFTKPHIAMLKEARLARASSDASRWTPSALTCRRSSRP